MGTLSITRKTSGTTATASGMNTNYDEIEAVVNGAIDATNLAADSVTNSELAASVLRSNYGLAQHTDGTIYIDLSSTSGLEFSSGELQVDAYGIISLSSDGVIWGRTGDVVLTSSASTPDGFTDVSATYADKVIRISATALSTGGSDTLAGASGSTTLTAAQSGLPAHTHTMPLYSPNNGGTSGVPQDTPGPTDTTSAATNANSAAAASSGHTHSLTSVACVPAYMTLKMLQKD